MSPSHEPEGAHYIAGQYQGATEAHKYEDRVSQDPEQLQLFPLPAPYQNAARPLTNEENDKVETLSRLQFFLATAPTRWSGSVSQATSRIAKFQLPDGEHVSCVFWNGLYHITGTDIVRALNYRFEAFGRPVKHTKKWEEGVFSDLRNLKPGTDSCLEDPKSALLDFLFRNGCIRTQKKQKVFYWFSVPHDRLFLDALERDLKREKAGQEPTSVVTGEPARSFQYDPRRSLYEQFAGQNPGLNNALLTTPQWTPDPIPLPISGGLYYPPGGVHPMGYHPSEDIYRGPPMAPVHHGQGHITYTQTVFEGSPAYKRRRVRSRVSASPSVLGMDHDMSRPYPDVRRSVSARSITPSTINRGDSVMPSGDESDTPNKRSRTRQSASVEGEDRTFICPFPHCMRPFKRLEHLKRHTRTHTQERPFECTICTRTFSRQDNLHQHQKTHGRGDTPLIDEAERHAGAIAFHQQNLARGLEPTESPARWATASPVGMGYGMPGQYRASPNPTQMLPPPLPTRHSTVPPDWPQPTPISAAPQMYAPSPLQHGTSAEALEMAVDPSLLRRHRSETPYGSAGPSAAHAHAHAHPHAAHANFAPPIPGQNGWPDYSGAHMGMGHVMSPIVTPTAVDFSFMPPPIDGAMYAQEVPHPVAAYGGAAM